MFHTNLTPPTFDLTAVDHYVAKGKRVRSQAIVTMIMALFKAPETPREITSAARHA